MPISLSLHSFDEVNSSPAVEDNRQNAIQDGIECDLSRNAANDDHLDSSETQNRLTLSIEMNRQNVKNDMLKVFSDESKLSFNIENMGNVEKGTGSGLIREAFSLFWNEAYDSLMLGVEERIPCIRHDYQRVQWEAVA